MTENDSRFSRRQMLSATGVAVATSLAGCNALPGGDDDGTETPTSGSDDFEYPNGFSEESIDLTTALGESSVMASLDSVTTGVNRSVTQGGSTQTSTQEGDFNKANNEFAVTQEATAGQQSSTQEYYFNDGIIFIKRNLPSQDPQFTKNTLEFDVRQMYNLSQIQEHLSGISVSVDSIEQRNGETVAVYTADETGITSDNIFSNLSASEQYGSISSAAIEVAVDQQGRIHLASFEVDFESTGDSEGTSLVTEFAFTNFNSTTVQKPSWVDTAEFQDLTTEPQVDVAFSEVEGEGVTVTVNSIQDADVVDIVIGGRPVQRLQETGEVTIPASAYTGQDGETIGTIEVYAYKQNQQPTKVDEYTPTAPAASDGNTTTETTTTNTSE